MKANERTKSMVFGFRVWILGFGLALCCLTGEIRAQSTNQNAPTPVTTNEISGTIRARDLGDARLTSFFYVFDGNQGDVFINIVTKNLNGDIDVFTADNLRPLTKIVVYADSSDSETGRVIYLRKPEKLILRIEGRTPDDNPASYRVKFAGSFSPVAGVADADETKLPEVKTDEQGEVRVNSVGTIIATRPKPTPQIRETPDKTVETEAKRETEKVKNERRETVKKIEEEESEKKTVAKNKKPRQPVKQNAPDREKDAETAENKIEAEKSSTENVTAPEKRSGEENEKTANSEEENAEAEKNVAKTEKPRRTKTPTIAKTEPKPKSAPTRPEPVASSQLENIRLIVVFKDGAKIEQPMSDVLKVGVDKGILTIIYKNGSIGRYSILDVAKMTIE